MSSYEIQVNTVLAGFEPEPTIAMDADGDFAIAWASSSVSGTTNITNVAARLFTPNGTPKAAEFQVNTVPARSVRIAPSVGMDDAGNFAIA